jgi:hypothetical protein
MNIGTASARLERGFAKWLEGETGLASFAATETDEKSIPAIVCESGEVNQPAWPHNFFEGTVEIKLQSCAPETSRDEHSRLEEEINCLLLDAQESADEINEARLGITVTGWRVGNCQITFDENRTVTAWTLGVDFSVADPPTS